MHFSLMSDTHSCRRISLAMTRSKCVKFVFFVVLIQTLNIVQRAETAKILYVSNSFSKSHVLLGELAKRGHQVTKISSFPGSKSVENLRKIHFPINENVQKLMNQFMNSSFWYGVTSVFPKIIKAVYISSNEMLDFIKNEKVMDENFDLVIVGYIFSDTPFLLGHHFNCPTILMWPRAIFYFIDKYVGNISPVSSVHVEGINRKMDFFDRILNFLSNEIGSLAYHYLDYTQNTIYR